MMLSTNEIAKRVNLTRARITQMIRDNIITAEKIGRDWVINENQIKIIQNLPENRGRHWREKSKQSNGDQSK